MFIYLGIFHTLPPKTFSPRNEMCILLSGSISIEAKMNFCYPGFEGVRVKQCVQKVCALRKDATKSKKNHPENQAN